MDYALAKELKDAGFPQSGSHQHGHFLNHNESGEQVYVPTLEELIEACGLDFLQLQAHNHPLDTHKKWTAWAITPDTGEGDTSAEAVGRLWLALNRTEAGKS
jgi:hypothetical protein